MSLIDSSATPSPGSVYLNTVNPINEEYSELRRHLKEMDTRVAYLQNFEMALSASINDSDLWSVSSYVAQQKATPMPDNEYAMLSFQEFRGWMVVYEMVMRSAGLIGTRKKGLMGWDE